MAAVEYALSGKVKWFRPKNPNEWGKWSHVLYPTKESLEIIRALQSTDSRGVRGIMNQLKMDDEGYYITIGRPLEINVRGKKMGMQPPKVFDGSKASSDGSCPLLPDDVAVGNGSDVTTKIEVYEHKIPSGKGKGKAMRWVSTRVDNLIPFERRDDLLPDEQKAADGLLDQPRPLF